MKNFLFTSESMTEGHPAKLCDTAAYGHSGRNDLDLPWERLDMAEALKTEF